MTKASMITIASVLSIGLMACGMEDSEVDRAVHAIGTIQSDPGIDPADGDSTGTGEGTGAQGKPSCADLFVFCCEANGGTGSTSTLLPVNYRQWCDQSGMSDHQQTNFNSCHGTASEILAAGECV